MFLAYKSDIGQKRDENQDRVRVGMIGNDSALAVVCDGMGGANSGSLASEIAINAVYDKIAGNYRENADENSIRNLLLTSVSAANALVYQESVGNEENQGMGTTCVAAIVRGKQVFVANVGDSRAYIMTPDGISQITNDHTLVEMLYEQGQLSREEADTHYMKNVITKAVGVDKDVETDYFEVENECNFTVLLCSDGLYNYCDNELMYNIVFGQNLDEAASKLVAHANLEGGSDNISIALLAN
ncbi:MAG: Stp1/IreP family PP2C-type Ser/Thr phosphatase [Ruminococcus sp.]|nr:Stp1/IreP family PP2C-type Ser/Thr phosphatase [Ruminococcus sp.]